MTGADPADTTQAVVGRHLQSFYALDLEGVVADYAPDAVLIVPAGVLRGPAEITPFFRDFFAGFAQPGATFEMQQQVVEGEVAYIRWVAETAGTTYELGTDTFVVRDGRITAQTYASKQAARS